jgi:PAS domain S-box-containing protein
MNNFFKRVSLPIKLLLLVLFPLVLIIILSFQLYDEKTKKVELLNDYLLRINTSSDISGLIDQLVLERRYSFSYSIKKDLDSRAEIDLQRTRTDDAVDIISQRNDPSLEQFGSYTFIDQLKKARNDVDNGAGPDAVLHYYTNAIFRLNTLNIMSAGSNQYLRSVFSDLAVQKLLSEMTIYLGIVRSNIYNILYRKKDASTVLPVSASIYEIYKSYETEWRIKASPELRAEFDTISSLKKTTRFLDQVFTTMAVDSSYKAEDWWKLSAAGTDAVRKLQQKILRDVRARMNKLYSSAEEGKGTTLIFLIVALAFVFGIIIYTTHIITQMLTALNHAAQKISRGGTNIQLENVSKDVIASLGESIMLIDQTNRQIADAADAIGKGNFNTALRPRSEDDLLTQAIIRMKNNLQRFTMEIEKSKEQFRQVADTAPVMIWMTDDKKLCNFVNQGWTKFTGRKKEDEIGYGWIEGMHPDDYTHAAEVFDDAFNARDSYYLEYRFRRHDGEYRWLSESGAPRYTPEGKFDGFIGSCIDIHEMKMLEQRKDDFIKMASHELKTPVTSIKGYVQLLLSMYNDHEKRKDDVPDSAVRSSLEVIDKQIVKLTRLMSELLDLSRIDTGKLDLQMTAFDLNELVEETVDDIRLTTGHTIEVQLDGEAIVYGDQDRISQVLVNLLTNAIKYSPGSTSISVEVKCSGNDLATVSVADRGIGINLKDQEKIFERFYRVEGKSEQTYPGFGIGLFIASEIIQRHHGTIGVSSEKGKGSRFTFILPTVS